MNLSEFSQFEFILIVVAVAIALWRRGPNDWSLALVVLLTPLALAIYSAGTFPYYPIPPVPLYGILIGSLFGEGLARNRVYDHSTTDRYTIPHTRLVAVITFMMVNLGLSLAVPLNHVLNGGPVRPQPPEAAQWVLDHVDPGETVVGDHTYYLWLLDYVYLSPLLPVYPESYPRDRDRYAGLSVGEIWDLHEVDVFILDPEETTAPVLWPLVEEGYFETHGYELAAQYGTTNICYHPPAD